MMKQTAQRLYDERLNPSHLRANLDTVIRTVLAELDRKGIQTTPGSITTCLSYIGQGNEHPNELTVAVRNALVEPQ